MSLCGKSICPHPRATRHARRHDRSINSSNRTFLQQTARSDRHRSAGNGSRFLRRKVVSSKTFDAGYCGRNARREAAVRNLYFAAILGAAVLTGCGGGGGGGAHTPSPPTISNLTYSPSAVPASGTGTTV